MPEGRKGSIIIFLCDENYEYPPNTGKNSPGSIYLSLIYPKAQLYYADEILFLALHITYSYEQELAAGPKKTEK